MSQKRYVICGDMNWPGSQTGKIGDNLEDTIARFNQKQLVSEPTHEAGNLLDLIIVPDTNINDVKDVSTQSLCFSNHSLVRCRLAFEGQRPAVCVNYSYRPIKQIDVEFLHPPNNGSVIESFSASDYAALFDNKMRRILDFCATTWSTTRRCRTHDAYHLRGQLNKTVVLNVVIIKRKLSSVNDKKESVHARDLTRSKITESRTNFIWDEDLLPSTTPIKCGGRQRICYTATLLVR